MLLLLLLLVVERRERRRRIGPRHYKIRGVDRGEQGGRERELAALFFRIFDFLEFGVSRWLSKRARAASVDDAFGFSLIVNPKSHLDGSVRHDLVPQHVQLPRGEALASAAGAVARAGRRRRGQGRRRELAS